ncbi:hypothetical protein B0H63DRAFT_222021 [Podospora didyma]|uniref:Uncharacterized protein n=1 Tax=Podospora didyma TaxID=330526 RepID=A0AAE0NBJ7_9PEZI|nr:hypothetical protein B0H63DRAFT_222021 [Podospora didyma]
MKIAYLQFAPSGDVQRDIDTASGLLRTTEPTDLDLLILPLALTRKASIFWRCWTKLVALEYDCIVVTDRNGCIDKAGAKPLKIYGNLDQHRLVQWDSVSVDLLEAKQDVVIVYMSWSIQGAGPADDIPDTLSLRFWIEKLLQPLLRAERPEETIVVFCNRCGIDGDVFYTGTSTVVGIQAGEVILYGWLGELERLLVGDTTARLGKLVQNGEHDPKTASAAKKEP